MRAYLIAIVVLAGCGGDDGVNISTNQDNVCDEMAEVACHNMYQCCSERLIEQILGVSDPRSESECRSDRSRECAHSIAPLEFAISQKHVRFDAKTMNDCLEAMLAPSDTCATLESALPWTDACMNSAWVGLVDNGGACLSTTECSSKDSFCGANQTCTALPTEGQTCFATPCASGLFCSTAGICTAKVATGGACTSLTLCADHLFCDFTTTSPVCAPLRAPSESCTTDAACTSKQCNPGTCMGSTQTCSPDSACGRRCADDNSTCFSDAGCADGVCSVGGTPCFVEGACGTGGTCVFPVKCNPILCEGEVCADSHVTVDYCQGTLAALPVGVGQRQAP